MPKLPLIAALLVLTCTGTAHANPFGYHEHDGFYLRFGGGVSLLSFHRDTDRSGSQGSLAYEDNSDTEGIAVNTELSIGGTPLKNLVVAGTAVFLTLPSAQLRLGSGARLNLDSSLNFLLFAPTADVYLDPNRGFHFGGGMGLAILRASLQDEQFNTIGGTGVGVTLHAGYDLWVGDDWCLGGQLRGVLARVNDEQSTSTVTGTERDSVAAISLVVTALYH